LARATTAALATFLAPALAAAQVGTAPPPAQPLPPTLPGQKPPDPRQHGVTMDGAIGGGTRTADQGESDGMPVFTFTTLYYGPLLELGISATAAFGMWAGNATLLTALGGVKLDPTPWVRFELLAEGGAHVYSGLGRGLFDDPIERRTETLPYLGGRGGVAFLLGGSHRFLVGAWLAAGHDLGERSGTVTVRSCFLTCTTDDVPYAVGGPSWSFTVRFGGVIAKF
jgi:hypothetical protein